MFSFYKVYVSADMGCFFLSVIRNVTSTVSCYQCFRGFVILWNIWFPYGFHSETFLITSVYWGFKIP